MGIVAIPQVYHARHVVATVAFCLFFFSATNRGAWRASDRAKARGLKLRKVLQMKGSDPL